MKRFVIFSLIIAMVAGAAFAQVGDWFSVGVWGRSAFVPLEVQFNKWDTKPDPVDSERHLTTSLGQSWGGSFGRSAGIGFHGTSDYAGFNVDIFTDGGAIQFGDFANLWVKPFDWLRFDYGKFNVDVLRGKIGDTDFFNFTLHMYAEDQIFNRFQGSGQGGFLMSITPIEGLFVGFHLPTIPGMSWGGSNNQFGEGTYAAETWSYFQAGAGYNIEGIGHIRAQYVGAPKLDLAAIQAGPSFNDHKRIELAFALGMLEGMTIDIGFKIPFAAKEEDGAKKDYSAWPGLTASVGANMGFGDIGIMARVDTFFAGNNKYDGDIQHQDGFNMNFHLVPSYNLGFATIGLEFGLDVSGKYKERDSKNDLKAVDKSNAADMGIGAWLKKPCGDNGSFKIGLGYTAIDLTSDAKTRTVGYFRIPLIGEIWF